ncbi:HAMP domain-containing sensor histidine kinase [Picosynechococcus sp. PCC 7117]|uniref:PAS domain-containing sensor histidine kinase n=1 Tax=Picosynechococcus sp. PCC 7117 TaxID=195498 RepID=UPI00081040E1|nr:HAMP domain-containing sensor histidine kinase [Picosynechococcus sp. PCC 7117]ANV88103.1 PAS domain-containing sensor histidine kinase [Picosynechococcus sp. PCC 7117]
MQYNPALIQALGDIVYERCLTSGAMVWYGDFTRVLGYSAAEMGNDCQTWLERIYPDDQTKVLATLEQAFAQQQAYELDYRFQHHDGSYVWIQDRGVPKDITAQDSDQFWVIGVMRDISDRKQVELDMHNALMREKELNQLKTRFIDIASHEFRTPLTSILGFTELLEQYAHKFNPEAQRRHLQRIKGAAQRLQTLVDDVLSVSRVDAGQLTLEPASVHFEGLCQDIIEELQVVFGHTHPIQFDFVPQYQGDRRLFPVLDAKIIRHILSNLLSNALKYSFPGEAVSLVVCCGDRQISITITDRGIGIPQADLPHLFEPFHRAQNVGKIPGTGLGLHIVKRYVDLHNGTIMVASLVNSGTTFRVKIPCSFVSKA